ncbi:depupylase/deamidase Dop [Zafaria sp. Z1313]|uniref:depupylase/deamidase Dop n=1 Tax=unclassified Zafaria TaxID=2828765 RepID=UPI002E78C726|nr:depupylase/deamidase Dop [Zafaria sp. J156]MEE1621213.1 depupylase/deamidase Dop [Zafaria sp. J156]
MTVHRVVGLETEYGVLAPSVPGANATILSAQVVNAYAAGVREARGRLAGTRWDYSDESPLADARGWQQPRRTAHPSQLTDAPRELTAQEVALAGDGARVGQTLYTEAADDDGADAHVLMNMVLGNGARLYVDHAHPEYSSPETTNPRDAVLWDQAGDLVALDAVRRIAAAPGFAEVLLYKNNTDNKGAGYGAHENYLMPRSVPFDDIAAGLLPFLASRPVVCGSGRVGRGLTGRIPGFQISQRADFFEAEVGLETTIRRPIVNTRDEPHAVWEKYRRLHVIAGDANLGQVPTLLRVGSTSLVLSLIEAGAAPRLDLRDPVGAVQSFSHDPSLRTTAELKDGRRLTALDLQEAYLEAARRHCASTGAGDPATAEVLERWTAVLDGLRSDPARVAPQVDWVAKLRLMDQYRERHGAAWDDPRIALMDLQWADVRPEKGLHHRLAERGHIERLFTPEEVRAAVVGPPEDTRAYFRGRALTTYPDDVVGASWDAVTFSVPGRPGVERVATLEPLRGTRALVGPLFEAGLEIGEFVDRLRGRS